MLHRVKSGSWVVLFLVLKVCWRHDHTRCFRSLTPSTTDLSFVGWPVSVDRYVHCAVLVLHLHLIVII